MGIKSLVTDTAGQVNVNPRRVKLISYDNLAAVTTAGYLNRPILSTFPIYPTDVFDVTYDYVDATNSGTYDTFTCTIVNGVVTLVLDSVGGLGNAALKTVSNASKALVASVEGATVINNLAKFSDITGTVENSGIAASAVQLSANIKAATTADIGGLGAGPLSVVVGTLTAASVVVATVESSSNPVSVIACTATATGFDITFSADPGASCLVNYIAFVVAQ